ncbi:unnamed protein product, partial [Symbiodinium necroappetens]
NRAGSRCLATAPLQKPPDLAHHTQAASDLRDLDIDGAKADEFAVDRLAAVLYSELLGLSTCYTLRFRYEPGPGTLQTVEAETDPSQKSKPPAPRIAGSPAKTAGTSAGTAVAKGKLCCSTPDALPCRLAEQDADELLQQCLEEQDQ